MAALLEIARKMQGKQFSRTVRFVLFANEEPPYFQRDGQMGSWVYAKACRANKDNLKVVLSLETMGYFTDEPNSQKYPPLLAAMYPSTGNFIGVTDTALFRYPHYHEQTDTVDKIEFVRYADVVDGLAKTIVEFADAEK